MPIRWSAQVRGYKAIWGLLMGLWDYCDFETYPPGQGGQLASRQRLHAEIRGRRCLHLVQGVKVLSDAECGA